MSSTFSSYIDDEPSDMLGEFHIEGGTEEDSTSDDIVSDDYRCKINDFGSSVQLSTKNLEYIQTWFKNNETFQPDASSVIDILTILNKTKKLDDDGVDYYLYLFKKFKTSFSDIQNAFATLSSFESLPPCGANCDVFFKHPIAITTLLNALKNWGLLNELEGKKNFLLITNDRNGTHLARVISALEKLEPDTPPRIQQKFELIMAEKAGDIDMLVKTSNLLTIQANPQLLITNQRNSMDVVNEDKTDLNVNSYTRIEKEENATKSTKHGLCEGTYNDETDNIPEKDDSSEEDTAYSHNPLLNNPTDIPTTDQALIEMLTNLEIQQETALVCVSNSLAQPQKVNENHMWLLTEIKTICPTVTLPELSILLVQWYELQSLVKEKSIDTHLPVFSQKNIVTFLEILERTNLLIKDKIQNVFDRANPELWKYASKIMRSLLAYHKLGLLDNEVEIRETFNFITQHDGKDAGGIAQTLEQAYEKRQPENQHQINEDVRLMRTFSACFAPIIFSGSIALRQMKLDITYHLNIIIQEYEPYAQTLIDALNRFAFSPFTAKEDALIFFDLITKQGHAHQAIIAADAWIILKKLKLDTKDRLDVILQNNQEDARCLVDALEIFNRKGYHPIPIEQSQYIFDSITTDDAQYAVRFVEAYLILKTDRPNTPQKDRLDVPENHDFIKNNKAYAFGTINVCLKLQQLRLDSQEYLGVVLKNKRHAQCIDEAIDATLLSYEKTRDSTSAHHSKPSAAAASVSFSTMQDSLVFTHIEENETPVEVEKTYPADENSLIFTAAYQVQVLLDLIQKGDGQYALTIANALIILKKHKRCDPNNYRTIMENGGKYADSIALILSIPKSIVDDRKRAELIDVIKQYEADDVRHIVNSLIEINENAELSHEQNMVANYIAVITHKKYAEGMTKLLQMFNATNAESRAYYIGQSYFESMIKIIETNGGHFHDTLHALTVASQKLLDVQPIHCFDFIIKNCKFAKQTIEILVKMRQTGLLDNCCIANNLNLLQDYIDHAERQGHGINFLVEVVKKTKLNQDSYYLFLLFNDGSDKERVKNEYQLFKQFVRDFAIHAELLEHFQANPDKMCNLMDHCEYAHDEMAKKNETSFSTLLAIEQHFTPKRMMAILNATTDKGGYTAGDTVHPVNRVEKKRRSTLALDFFDEQKNKKLRTVLSHSNTKTVEIITFPASTDDVIRFSIG